MEIVNNTETEKLRAAVNEALNPEEVDESAYWNLIENVKNDIINFRYRGRMYSRGMPDDPQLAQLIEEHIRLMEAYFNNAKEILRVALEKVSDGWKKTENQSYLDREFTPTWNR